MARSLVWPTIAASCAAGAAGFLALDPLRDDPLPGLRTVFRIAAFLQPVPYLLAAGMAVCLRRRPAVLGYTLAAVLLCGGYGWWRLAELVETRRVENEPVRRRALGNIFPDIEGQVGAVEALLWPVAVLAVIGGATLVGWLVARRAPERRARTAGSAPPPRS